MPEPREVAPPSEERRWVDVKTFADYLGVSRAQAYKMAHDDPDVKRVTRRFGRRVLVCLWAFQQGEERRMAESA